MGLPVAIIGSEHVLEGYAGVHGSFLLHSEPPAQVAPIPSHDPHVAVTP